MSAEEHSPTVNVAVPDGSVSSVRVYPASEPAARPLVVLFPGLGVGARYFRPIAEELAARGLSTACGELRGQGASTAHATRSNRWGYHHMASQDYPLTIRAVKQELGLSDTHPTVLLTHSMGGQIASLFLSRKEAEELGVIAMFGVGVGSPYHKAFPPKAARRIRIGTNLMGGAARVLGYWPGPIAGRDISGYGRQSGPHILEWRRLAYTNSFAGLSGADIDYPAAMKKVTSPVLLTRFGNDGDCSIASCEALADHLPSADVNIEELHGDLGHNRWARQPTIVANRFEDFLKEIGQ